MSITKSIMSGLAAELSKHVDWDIFVRVEVTKCMKTDSECLALWFNTLGSFSSCCKSNLGVIVFVRDGLARVAFGLWADDHGWEVADSYFGAVELTDPDLVDELEWILAGITIMWGRA